LAAEINLLPFSMIKQHASVVLYNKTLTEQSQHNTVLQEAMHGGLSPAQHLQEFQPETETRKHVLIAHSHFFYHSAARSKSSKATAEVKPRQNSSDRQSFFKGRRFIKSETFYPANW